jgi:hypothetical protein
MKRPSNARAFYQGPAAFANPALAGLLRGV